MVARECGDPALLLANVPHGNAIGLPQATTEIIRKQTHPVPNSVHPNIEGVIYSGTEA